MGLSKRNNNKKPYVSSNLDSYLSYNYSQPISENHLPYKAMH